MEYGNIIKLIHLTSLLLIKFQICENRHTDELNLFWIGTRLFFSLVSNSIVIHYIRPSQTTNYQRRISVSCYQFIRQFRSHPFIFDHNSDQTILLKPNNNIYSKCVIYYINTYLFFWHTQWTTEIEEMLLLFQLKDDA